MKLCFNNNNIFIIFHYKNLNLFSEEYRMWKCFCYSVFFFFYNNFKYAVRPIFCSYYGKHNNRYLFYYLATAPKGQPGEVHESLD